MDWMLVVALGVLFMITATVGMVVNRRNLIVMLLCVELMFLASSLNFVVFSRLYEDFHSQVMVLFILAIAAAESAIALALFVLMYRHYHAVDAKVLTNIRG
ncbi:MAG: NADH-quinone oxidoreductase subunit NuoK [Legionellales bacterium]|nr:NADH-quinone oxidoreductase subunit NuoK [Legionellales bacterium]HAV93405.1 NADH-quinone oxidoreductase subunit NuoK [Pseudomonadota bacterium]|tara:strand:- start:459 stop:761 length:303 start_codon:yes stop_codon:yes gene_type:complete